MRPALALALVALWAAAARAKVMPLERLPDEKWIALAPLLAQADVALVESTPSGAMKQVTLALYVAAPPAVVHDVVARPWLYRDVIPNLSRCDWEPRGADGGLSSWKIDLPISSFQMTNLFTFEPGAAGAVRVTSPDEHDDATFRWEFLPAPGGGTVLVQYGYSDVKHASAVVRAFIARMPVMEHGLALSGQLLLAANMRTAAEKRVARGSVTPPAADKRDAASYEFLLPRGQVVLLRTRKDGKLGDVSVIDRVYAPLQRVGEILARPVEWCRFVPAVEECHDRGRGPGTIGWVADWSLPLQTWTTGWVMRMTERSYEAAGVSGDLEGAHFRFDLTPRAAGETEVVYRANLALAHASVIARKLFQYEPWIEHGLNVAFSLVYLRAVRGRAEGWLAAK
jgi:hypothetical protein